MTILSRPSMRHLTCPKGARMRRGFIQESISFETAYHHIDNQKKTLPYFTLTPVLLEIILSPFGFFGGPHIFLKELHNPFEIKKKQSKLFILAFFVLVLCCCYMPAKEPWINVTCFHLKKTNLVCSNVLDLVCFSPSPHPSLSPGKFVISTPSPR